MAAKTQGFLLHPLLHSCNLLEERLRIRLAPHGIQPRQARILAALNRMGSASQVELAREFHISPASMSTMSSRLISAGLISRRPNQQTARCNILTLTGKGREMLLAIHEAWHDMDRLIEDSLGVEKARMLAEAARELRNALGGHPPGAKRKGGDGAKDIKSD
uniref:MarR family winged helix-turn-helix transcriptional regulator n=1 Tax=Pararhizobium sp. IMCC3301 TaxID=3067904 RepID=UPI0027410B15|nr:MarR family winged helix-turn-helix transcriptional regulator [Pararhizobium sp. IMCC3301]